LFQQILNASSIIDSSKFFASAIANIELTEHMSMVFPNKILDGKRHLLAEKFKAEIRVRGQWRSRQ